MEQVAALGGMMLVVFLVALVLFLLVGGLVLKLSVRMIEGFPASYGRSIGVVLLTGIVLAILNTLLFAMLGMGAVAGMDPNASPEAVMAAAGGAMAMSSLVGFVGGLLVTALFTNLLIKHPDGRSIGFGRSCLVALVYIVIMTILAVVASIGLGIIVAMMGIGAASLAG